MTDRSKPAAPSGAARMLWLCLVAGLFLSLALIKLGNPLVLVGRVSAPATAAEMWDQSWPATWGYLPALVLVAAGLCFVNRRVNLPRWLFWAPVAWLAWQGVSALTTVDARLTWLTLPHFVVVVGMFYLGLLGVSRWTGRDAFWWGLLVGVVVVLAVGFRQHYGNLDQTAEYIEQNEKTHWREVPPETVQELVHDSVLIPTSDGGYTANPEVLKRIGKRRIFSTLVNPNALAGVIILLLPPLAAFLWLRLPTELSQRVRLIGVGLFIYAGLACLFWSGSKAGWLIVLLQLGVLALQLPFSPRLKQAAVVAVLVLGLAGFAVKYAGYFKKGATSVEARFECWRVALKVVATKPILGTGPGTFGVPFAALKKPEAEMSHLTHNDYLEQACDSGLPGFSLFLAWFGGLLVWVYRERQKMTGKIEFGLALGILGWAAQAMVEFGLYIPALAWGGALLLGILVGRLAGENESTSPVPVAKVRPAR